MFLLVYPYKQKIDLWLSLVDFSLYSMFVSKVTLYCGLIIFAGGRHLFLVIDSRCLFSCKGVQQKFVFFLFGVQKMGDPHNTMAFNTKVVFNFQWFVGGTSRKPPCLFTCDRSTKEGTLVPCWHPRTADPFEVPGPTGDPVEHHEGRAGAGSLECWVKGVPILQKIHVLHPWRFCWWLCWRLVVFFPKWEPQNLGSSDKDW